MALRGLGVVEEEARRLALLPLPELAELKPE